MSIKSLSALASALALAGCSSMLNPAPSASEVPGATDGAYARAQGVQLVAKAGAWEGTPSTLARRLTPMWVSLTNHGSAPVLVRYNDLMLVAAKGRVYKALPPFQIDGEVTQRAEAMYPPSQFAYAPYLAPYVAGASPYPGTFPSERAYWDHYGPVLKKVDLPTMDMVQRALPEGVLMPGGKVSGFLYFPGIDPKVQSVRLRANLMNAATGSKLVTLAIPFRVG